MNRLTRRLVLTLLSIGLTLAIGTIGFVVIDDYPPFDAFYMTLTTMTTVGYGEVHPLSHAGRVFNSFLIIFGVTTILIAIGAMTQSIIEIEFGDIMGQRRNKRMIEKLKDHYIICGFGRVGRGAAAELLQEGVPFVVIDSSPERVERAILSGMLAVAADATRDETLRQVGIDRARGLVAALATDADNLFVLLSAKGLNHSLYVAARAAEEGAEEKMRRAGADAVFAPYTITGHRLAQSLLRPHVVQFLDFTTKAIGEDISLEQVRVSASSQMISKSIRDMQLGRDLGVIVMAIRNQDGRMVFNPPADTAVRGGDHLIVMGRQESLRTLEDLLAGRK
ncbi:MAG TPA: potassium channel protein [Candidatus Sulfopaludibacter sp.]|jgi:voltage-gated potassium channel|nr:potassium channel protein [Candidatus Sulfopaludibacter sp.]